MVCYMGGEVYQKRVFLVMNGNGGSGYEIWQYQDRIFVVLMEDIYFGDMGVNYISIKSYNFKEVCIWLE